MPNIISIRDAELIAHEAANNFHSFTDDVYLDALEEARLWAQENIGGEGNIYPPIHGKKISIHLNAVLGTAKLKELKNLLK